jgi:hypothetical protein
MENPPNQSNNNGKKGRKRITPTKDRGETPNNKTLQQGALKMLVIKTRMGEIQMVNNTKGRKITFKLISLAHYVVNMVIILTTSLKLLITSE